MARETIRNSSLYRRCKAISVLERLKIDKLQRQARLYLGISIMVQNRRIRRDMRRLALLAIFKSRDIERALRFAGLNDYNFYNDCRFRLEDLPRLLRCLRLPHFQLDNGVNVNS